jgi:hypothetical protein
LLFDPRRRSYVLYLILLAFRLCRPPANEAFRRAIGAWRLAVWSFWPKCSESRKIVLEAVERKTLDPSS